MYIRQQILPRKGKAIIQHRNRKTTMKGYKQICLQNNNQKYTHKKNFPEKLTCPILWEYQPQDPNKKTGKIDFLNVSDIQGAQASSFIHEGIKNKFKAQDYIQKSRIYQKQNLDSRFAGYDKSFSNYYQLSNFGHSYSLPKSKITNCSTEDIHRNLNIHKNINININPSRISKQKASLSNLNLDYTLNQQSLYYELEKRNGQRQKQVKYQSPTKFNIFGIIQQERQLNFLSKYSRINNQNSLESPKKYNPTYLSSAAY